MGLRDRVVGRVLGLGTRSSAVPSFRALTPKAPAGALAQPVWYTPNQPVMPDLDGETAIKMGYQRSTYAYRAVNCLASDIAKLPFRAGPLDAVSTERFNLQAPLARLLGPAPGSPNPRWSAGMLWRYGLIQYLVLGKLAWVYGKDATGRIDGLWPLQAQHLFPVPNTDGRGSDYFSHFEYGVRGSVNFREYSLDEVCYLYRPSQLDFLKPESPIEAAAPDINVAHLINQFDAAFLQNGGVPAHMVITPPFATGPDRQSFREQFTSRFGGPSNAGKVMFAERELEPGDGGPSTPDSVEVKVLGTHQRDSEMAVLRESKVRDLMVALGVPMSMLGDSSGRTFSNAEREAKNYWRGPVMNLVREIQDQVNINVSPKLGTETGWFDTSGVPELAPDPKFPDDRSALELIAAEVITVDEYRRDKGLPPAGEVGLPERKPASQQAPVQDSHSVPATAEETPRAQGPSQPVSIPSQGAGRPAPEIPSTADSGPIQGQARSHAAPPVVERMLAKQLQESMKAQAASARAKLTGRRGRRAATQSSADPSVLYDTGYWSARLAEELAPALSEMGYTEERTAQASSDVTARVFGQLAGLPDLADPDAVANVFLGAPTWALPQLASQDTVDASVVEQALLAIYEGNLTADAVLEGWK